VEFGVDLLSRSVIVGSEVIPFQSIRIFLHLYRIQPCKSAAFIMPQDAEKLVGNQGIFNRHVPVAKFIVRDPG